VNGGVVNPNAGAKDPRRALDRFLLLRTIVACLVVGAGVTIVALTENTFDAKPLYLLLAVSAVVGTIALTLTRAGMSPRRVSWGVVVADIGFAAGIVYYSGGVSGQFTTVFCLTIAAAAFLLEMPGGLVSGVLSSLCFIAFQLLEAWAVISPPGKSELPQPHVGGLIDAYMHASMFLLVGTVGGYLADRIKLKGRALQHAESALEQLRIDTNYILENMSSGVLVVDIELAEGNGVAVIRQARQLYPPDGQPLIVVLTNYASDFVRDHCFAAGADYFLDKMRDIALLKAIVADGQSKWTPPRTSH